MAEYGTHQTEIILLNVPFDQSYKDVIKFNNATEQAQYFSSRPGAFQITDESNKFRFIDGEGVSSKHRDIKINVRPERADTFNYLMYNNRDEAGAGWTYMFITGVDYINYETSLLHLEEDIWQSHMFQYKLKPSMIQRQLEVLPTKIDDPEAYKYCGGPFGVMYPKNRSFEDFIIGGEYYNAQPTDLFTPAEEYKGFCYYLQLSQLLYFDDNDKAKMLPITSNINGSVLPFGFIFFDTVDELSGYLQALNIYAQANPYNASKLYSLDHILGCGIVYNCVVDAPSILCSQLSTFEPRYTTQIPYGLKDPKSDSITGKYEDWNIKYFGIRRWASYTQREVIIDLNSHFHYSGGRLITKRGGDRQDLYFPTNSKLLSSPYSVVTITIPGQELNINPENWAPYSSDKEGVLTTKCEIGVDYSFENNEFVAYVYPRGYNYPNENYSSYDKMLKVPMSASLPYSINSYFNYIANNKNTLDVQKQQNTLAGISGAIQLGLASAGSGGYSMDAGMSQIGSAMRNRQAFDAMKDDMRGAMNVTIKGDVSSALSNIINNHTPKVIIKQIDPEVVIDTDHYFSAFGEKVCLFDTPLKDKHDHWDYVQTNGCNISPVGSASFMDATTKEKIENIYDNGVRIWYEPEHYLDFEYYNWNYNNI